MTGISVAPTRFLEDIGVIDGREIQPGLDPIFHQVWPDGDHANDALINIYGGQAILQHRLGLIAPTLAWVSFARLSPNQRETVERPLPTKYVVDREEYGLTLLTEDQIFGEGELRPVMASWLGALVSRGRFSSLETNPFIEML